MTWRHMEGAEDEIENQWVGMYQRHGEKDYRSWTRGTKWQIFTRRWRMRKSNRELFSFYRVPQGHLDEDTDCARAGLADNDDSTDNDNVFCQSRAYSVILSAQRIAHVL